MEQSNLEKLELGVRKLQQELDHLNQDKLSLHKDIAAMQQQLQGTEQHSGPRGFFLLLESSPNFFLVTEVYHADGHGVSFRTDTNILKYNCGDVSTNL